ncbi:MAG TPA: hypothetical protein VM621_11510 [Luteibacter sp.]|uniref:hypothetical protein n=1 Tax=Luteibacter sp. TaxID=1886636 RepID=UPI002B909825|nr:hypothetical protein [Luteibacter sp.]HVI55659.1 hypothetical protein [Luteibacter sp.]
MPSKMWTYPFPLRNLDQPNDMRSHFEAMSTMKFGFFPLSATGAAQGSIHFGRDSNAALNQDDGFHCIADGEVVAYRLDSTLCRLDYDPDRVIFHSLGFVLVRHRIALPPEPVAPADDGGVTAGEAAIAPPAGDGIDVYSLYTYTRPLDAYPYSPPGFTEGTLPYWKGTRTFRAGERSSDRQKPPHTPDSPEDRAARRAAQLDPAAQAPAPVVGLNIRSEGRSGARILGILPRGSVITARDGKDHGWAQLQAIRTGAPVGAIVGDAPDPTVLNGWVFLGELDANNQPDADTLDRVVVLETPHPVKAGDLLGYLGENTGPGDARPPTGAAQSRPALALEVFAGDGFTDYLAEARRRAAAMPDREKSILVIEAGATLCSALRPADANYADDHQVVPDANAPSGGILVHGQLHRVAGRQPGNIARGEKTTGFHRSADGLRRIESAEYTALSSSAKTEYPMIEVLAPITPTVTCWADRTDSLLDGAPIVAWTTAPLSLTDANVTTGYEAIFHRAELNALAKERKFVEPDGTLWWQVELGSPDNAPILAWVREKEHPGTRWEIPHAWPGFTVIDGTLATPENAFRRHVCITGRVRPEEEEEFQASASELSQSAFIRGIETAIDKAGTLDGKVTGADIGKARSSYWLSHALSRLIVRFESQWSEDMSRWRCLDQVMHPDWLVEMQRQEKRAWWGVMAGQLEGFPSDAHVHHIHPFGWVDNFKPRSVMIDVEEFIRLYLAIHAELGAYQTKERTVVRAPPMKEASTRNLRELLTRIIALYGESNEDPSIPHIAYMLATARHEAYNPYQALFFSPISERISEVKAEIRYGLADDPDLDITKETDRKKQRLKNERSRKNGNTEPGDGFRYRGRGFVQITWKNNYKRHGRNLNIDLVANPDLALDWTTASRIMFFGMKNGLFTGRSLADYTHEGKTDYVKARSIINGDEREAQEAIASFALAIEACLRAASR